jgi:hypothetical protein
MQKKNDNVAFCWRKSTLTFAKYDESLFLRKEWQKNVLCVRIIRLYDTFRTPKRICYSTKMSQMMKYKETQNQNY